MARDRVFIDSTYRTTIDEIKEKNILGFKLLENKDLFLLAVALGLDSPEQIKNKDGWFQLKNKSLKATDKALLASVLLSNAQNDEQIDEYADLDKSLDLCEDCAQSGFKKLFERANEANMDRELIERRLLKDLDLWYLSLVESDI